MNKLNSPLFMFHAPKDFFEKGTAAASESFKSEPSQIKKFDSLVHAKLCMPIVNITFGLELALKGLIKQVNRPLLRTHDLLRLFNALETGTQQKIIVHYQSHDHYKKYIAIRLVSGDGSEHGSIGTVPSFSKDEQGVREMLGQHQNYFEEFRYLFEYDENREMLVYFREISNFSYSVLAVFGETLNLKVAYTVKKKAV